MTSLSVIMVHAITVPPVPDIVSQPRVTWREAALIIPLCIAGLFVAGVLAWGFWPRSPRRRVSPAVARWLGVALIALVVLGVGAMFVSRDEDRRYADERRQRDLIVDSLVDDAIAEIVMTYGVTPTDDARADLGYALLDDADRTFRGEFVRDDGSRMECDVATSTAELQRSLTLTCPSVDG